MYSDFILIDLVFGKQSLSRSIRDQIQVGGYVNTDMLAKIL